MAFYRSELQVPVNKINSESKSNIDSKDNQMNFSSSTSSTLDDWYEKIKSNLRNDKVSFNSIRDNLLSDDFPNQFFSKADNKDVNCFSALNMFQQLQSKIALGSDGNMHFTAKFEVKECDTESIKVFVKEGSLIISVQQDEMQSAKMSRSKEYTRKFNLPPRIILDSITCTLSDDNILSLDGALETSCSTKGNINASTSSATTSPNISTSSSYIPFKEDSKYRININIGVGYEPSDINLKTRDDKLFINARHEEKCESRINYREFSKEITLPEKVDVFSLSAIYKNGILYVEAPLSD